MSHFRPRAHWLVLIMLWLVSSASPLRAALTGVSEIVPVADYSGMGTEVRMPIVIETNHITGDYVVCWATAGGMSDATLHCTRFDDENNNLAAVTLDIALNIPSSIEELHIDAAVNHQGQFYVAWTDGTDGHFAGFDGAGAALFLPIAITGDWVDFSMAVAPDYLWVGGFQKPDNSSLWLATLRFNPNNGAFIDSSAPLQLTGAVPEGCTSDLASTTSGDILLTWVLPPISGPCIGPIWARTFLQNGTPITDEVELSQNVSDEMHNLDPHAVAHDNGEYVVTWFNVTTSMLWSAALTFGGTVAVPQNSLIPAEEGTPFRSAGYPQNLDYVAVASIGSPNPDCALQSRLLFGGDLVPEANIPLGLCTLGFDIAFRQDGGMMLSRWSNPVGEDGQIEVAIFPRPAEIDVSPITLSEGDPQRTIGNYATLTVALSRPHPLGEDISVNYFTRDNTAFAGFDYQQTSDTTIFDAMSGDTTEMIQIPIIADTVYEANELFSVNLSNADNAVIRNGGESAIVTILNDDRTPEISPDCAAGGLPQCREIQEMGPGEFTDTIITLTMAEPLDLPVNIGYETQMGGPDPTLFAMPGSDYVHVSGSVQIPAGFTEAAFTITVVGDDVPESTETFQVVLSGGPWINLPQPPTLTLHIIDDNLCFLELDTHNLVFEMAGGTLPIELTTLDNSCQWSASPNQPWVGVAPQVGEDSQTVQVIVDAWNPAGQLNRSAEVTFELTGGNGMDTEVLTVVQDGNCEFSTDLGGGDFTAEGGDGTFAVTASDPACEWFVFTDEPWINISNPTEPVTGSGTVNYSVSGNGSVNVENGGRTATLISQQFDFEVLQVGCEYDVDPGTVAVEAGGNSTVDINVLTGPSVCQWTAVSNSVWIVVASGASGGGGGTVRLDVIENPSVAPRIGSVTIADELVTVEQDGQPCVFDTSPASLEFCPDGDGFDIDIAATAGCEWNLMEAEDWIAILSNSMGNGDETAMGVVDANLSEMDRASSIELISTQTGLAVDQVQIQQQGFLEYEPFDGPLPSDWDFDPSGGFAVVGGQLTASFSGGGNGLAIHQNPMGTCSDCKVESTVAVTSVTSQSEEVIALVGWYASDDEFIALGMDEFANMWNLYQVSGGAVVASNSVMVDQILPNQPYSVAIRYDGTTIHGFVDGNELLSVEKQVGTDPFGYAGFMVNGSNAQFNDLRVTGVFEDAGLIHIDSFETQQPVSFSVCTQQ